MLRLTENSKKYCYCFGEKSSQNCSIAVTKTDIKKPNKTFPRREVIT